MHQVLFCAPTISPHAHERPDFLKHGPDDSCDAVISCLTGRAIEVAGEVEEWDCYAHEGVVQDLIGRMGECEPEKEYIENTGEIRKEKFIPVTDFDKHVEINE